MPKKNKENKHSGSDANHSNNRSNFSYEGSQYTARGDGEVHGNDLRTKSYVATERLENITPYINNTPYQK